MNSDGDIDYSDFTRAELIEARGSIDERRYPKNLANLEAALAGHGIKQEDSAPIEQSDDKVGEKGLQAFGIIGMGLGSLGALYLGIQGVLKQYLVLERQSRNLYIEFEGTAAIIASLGLIIMSLTIAAAGYFVAANRSAEGLPKRLMNIAWIGVLVLLVSAWLM